jgi:outer membrane protein OmpA-like peptidoglycan-associated protein
MIVMKHVISLIFLCMTSGFSSFAQSENFILYNPIHYGIGIQGGLGLHSTNGNLRCLADPACPTYENGSGGLFGIMGSIEWMPNDWGFRGALGVNLNSATLTITDDRARVKDANGMIVPLIREHAIKASLPSINLELGVQKSFGNTRVILGPNIGYVLSPTWKSTSTIISPQTVSFQSGSKDTVFLEEDIPNVNAMQFGMGFGIGHHMQLSKNMILVPEVSASIPFSKILSGPEWKQLSIMLGFSVRWGIGAQKEEVLRRAELIDTIHVQVNERIGEIYNEGKQTITKDIEEYETYTVLTETTLRTDTLKIGLPPKQKPMPSISAYIKKDEQSDELDGITIEGQLVTEAFPILPMVFFEESDPKLHPRYKQLKDIDRFSSDRLEPFVSEQHRDVLNIIGERLKRNTKSTITLRGYSDPVTEKSDCDLARNRAETVRDYFMNIWSIDGSRITLDIDSRSCEPDNLTMSRNTQGYEENRRIEVFSDDKEILSPVIRSRYVELTAFTPNEYHLHTKETVVEDVKQWKIEERYGDTVLRSREGSSLPQWLPMSIAKEDARLMQQSGLEYVEIVFSVKDGEGEEGIKQLRLPINRDTINYAIQRLSLMHFPVQQSTLNRQAKNAIDAFVENLEDNATISIIGYSDNLGNAQSNVELSKERAESVYKYIRGIKPKSNFIKVDGVGSKALPPGIRSHELPESRFLSRTVQIEIIRTWKNVK